MRGPTTILQAAAAVCAGGALAVALALPATAARPPEKLRSLRTRDSALAAQSAAATLELYALQTRLDGARAGLAEMQQQLASLRRDQAVTSQELAAARHVLQISQHQLAAQLRALYEKGEPDPVAVLLGAQSLDEALASIDDLSRSATLNRDVIAQMQTARERLRREVAVQADRARRLRTLQARAVAAAASLTQAEADRRSFLNDLAVQRRMNSQAISALEAQVRAAQLKAEQLTIENRLSAGAQSFSASAVAQAAVPAPHPDAAPPEAVAAASPATDRPGGAAPNVSATGDTTMVVSAVAYHLPGHTASGLPVGWGVIAVDPSVIPLGTRAYVPGYGEAVAADVGSAVRGAMIDLWFPTTEQALAWGRQTLTITIHH